MSKTVLVIENDKLNSKLVHAILEANDFHVHLYTMSETAFMHLTEKLIPLPDVIILNVCDDDPFCRKFCKLQLSRRDGKKIPIIATCHNTLEEKEKQDLAAHAYLHHPYSLFELMRLLKTI